MNGSKEKQTRAVVWWQRLGLIAALGLLLGSCSQQISDDTEIPGGMSDGKLVTAEADVFGRAPVARVEGFTNNGDAAVLTKMLNNRGKDTSLTFKPVNSMVTHTNGLPTGVEPTWFIIDLKDEYDVSLIRAEFDNHIMVSFESDQTNVKKVANFIKIDLSTSANAATDPASADWITVADKASLRSERGYIR